MDFKELDAILSMQILYLSDLLKVEVSVLGTPSKCEFGMSGKWCLLRFVEVAPSRGLACLDFTLTVEVDNLESVSPRFQSL